MYLFCVDTLCNFGGVSSFDTEQSLGIEVEVMWS